MGKVLWMEDEEQLDMSHPGCISGIFHALQHQYRHSNVKKILPHKRHDTLTKQAKYNRRPNRISNDQDSFEVLRLLDVETNPNVVNLRTGKTSSTRKKSLKARIKGFIAEEVDKDNHSERSTGFLPLPRLQRTYSVHHSESDEWVDPTIFFPENVNSEESTEEVVVNPVNAKESSQNVINAEIKDHVDILEIFNVNKQLFLNVMQDGPKVSDKKVKLTKSGSFPTAYKSGSKMLRPSLLKDKLNEFYSVSKKEKRSDTRAPKLSSPNSGLVMTGLDKQGQKNSEDDLNSGNLVHIRRISSLNESANRYAHLFDYSASREAKLRPSRSLNLTNESENPSSSQVPIFFKRIHSLPHIDNQESSDAHVHRSASQRERNPVALLLSTEKNTCLDSTEGSGYLNGMVDRCDIGPKDEETGLTDEGTTESTGFGEELEKLMIEEGNCQEVPGITTTKLIPVLVPEYCSQDKESQSEFHTAEGLELLNNSEEISENEIKNANNNGDLKSYVKDNDDVDFTYVREILDHSGFIKNGFRQPWYSSNQPLDPLVFQEIESQYIHDPECFEEEIIELSHRLLLFELVDEVLLNMYERSYTYYPKTLSSSCHFRLAPTGEHVLEEVWKSVSGYLNLNPDMTESLDSIVSQDLRRQDGWMNLQFDSECVALELEELILDELLEKVFSYYKSEKD